MKIIVIIILLIQHSIMNFMKNLNSNWGNKDKSENEPINISVQNLEKPVTLTKKIMYNVSQSPVLCERGANSAAGCERIKTID